MKKSILDNYPLFIDHAIEESPSSSMYKQCINFVGIMKFIRKVK